MAKRHVSQKVTQIDRANTTMVVVVAVSAFVFIFSLVASHALWSKMSYQSKIIGAKEKARDQLIANINKVGNLVVSYKAFVETADNILGGSPSGKGDKDGNNAKIVLDALPSKYDFPGLTTSIEKILKNNNSSINSISGTDDELSQVSKNNSNQPIAMSFKLSANGTYDSTQKLLGLLQNSIRPIHVKQLGLASAENGIEVTVTADSYYQPEKTLTIQKKVIK